MRTDVSFTNGNLTLRGWKFREGSDSNRRPAIVMAHGFSAVKEFKNLPAQAQEFADAGFVVLLFDFRGLGQSDGMPRSRIVAHEQREDYRAAIDWITAQPDVDAERIGIWGTSFCGGHVLVVGALDPRVKVIVAQVPGVGSRLTVMKDRLGQEKFQEFLRLLSEEGTNLRAGRAGRIIPVVSADGSFSAVPGRAVYDYAMDARRTAPNWRNEVTLDSLAQNMAAGSPFLFVEIIAPKPLLIQAARHDMITPIERMKAVFETAGEPKRLEIYECDHFGVYSEPICLQTQTAATSWFKQHL